MNIKIYRVKNGYRFSIGGKEINENGKGYPSFHKAVSTARFLNQKISSFEDLSKPIYEDEEGEQMYIDHCWRMLRSMSEKIVGIEDAPKEDREKVYEFLKLSVKDVLSAKEKLSDNSKRDIRKILNKYREIAQSKFQDFLYRDKKEKELSSQSINSLNKFSSRMTINDQEMEEILDHYGVKVCDILSGLHELPIHICDPFKKKIKIISAKNGDELIDLSFNEKINLCKIEPGKIILPIHSPFFYQRYWKPIVECVGHFYMDDYDLLIIPEMDSLPDIPDDEGCCNIKGWCPNQIKSIPVSFHFNCNDDGFWKISVSDNKDDISKLSSVDVRSRVMCVDERLNIHGKIGEVVQVIPINEGYGFELDVNFGRKIVRLHQNQIKQIN